MTSQLSCTDRVQSHLTSRLDDLTQLWAAYCEGNEDSVPDLGTFNEYGLSFDYVEPGTFTDQPEGYHRYQLSWGGPSDEFRFFTNHDLSLYRIEYWFVDWFDGAPADVTNNPLMSELWDFFVEIGSAEHAIQEAAA